jgi:hypothetical protein
MIRTPHRARKVEIITFDVIPPWRLSLRRILSQLEVARLRLIAAAAADL